MKYALQIGTLAAFLVGLSASDVLAQRSSLYQARVNGQPLLVENNSWLYVQMPPVRELQVHDLLTIIVKQAQQAKTEGQINRITQSNIDARLRDWIQLDHFGIKAAPQTSGDPRARGSLDSQLRTNAELDTSSFLQFTITAEIVDIRPNGTLVLEAHSSQEVDGEVVESSLTGLVRREDVLPNNTVFSEKLADLKIKRRQTGHVHDAYRRGWLLRFYDDFKPF